MLYMVGFESDDTYSTAETAWHYTPNGDVFPAEPVVTDIERGAMTWALQLAEEALHDGNPPVGAVLLVNSGEHSIGAKTHDKISRNLMGHAELVAYEDAHKIIGDDLSGSTLITTAVPCTSCTPHYAEGKIGKVIAAAPRRLIYPLAGIMRPRAINMHDLLADGETDTTVVLNHRLTESLGKFATYGLRKGRRSELEAITDPYLVAVVSGADKQAS